MTTSDLTPVRVQEIALRNAYAAGDPERCAAHHLNLANQLEHAGADPLLYIAHRVAGGVLRFQLDSDAYPEALGELALSYVRFAPRRPPLPDTFDELCRLVEQVEGVRFRAMVEQLGQGGGADGDEAMHAVAGMARYMAG